MKKTKKSKLNYKIQNGCHNCKYVFEKSEWDDPNELFCLLNAPKRPICGSVLMDEGFSKARGKKVDSDFSKAKYKSCSNRDPFVKAMKAWDKWSEGRSVNREGICDLFKKK